MDALLGEDHMVAARVHCGSHCGITMDEFFMTNSQGGEKLWLEEMEQDQQEWVQ